MKRTRLDHLRNKKYFAARSCQPCDTVSKRHVLAIHTPAPFHRNRHAFALSSPKATGNSKHIATQSEPVDIASEGNVTIEKQCLRTRYTAPLQNKDRTKWRTSRRYVTTKSPFVCPVIPLPCFWNGLLLKLKTPRHSLPHPTHQSHSVLLLRIF